MNGEYIVDRWMVKAIADICREHDIALRRFSDDWVLELEKDGVVGRLFGYKCSLNDSAVASITQDKVASYEILHSGDIHAVPHALMRTKIGELRVDGMQGEVVLKPLTGTSGHMVRLFNTLSDAYDFIHDSKIEAWAVSPRVAIERETRLIVLDGEVLLAYDKVNPVLQNGLPMFNLGKGARPHTITPAKEQEKLAVDASKRLGLRICAVDLIETEDGEQMVLEVNDGIMMEYYRRFSSEHEQRARAVFERIVLRMLNI